MCSKSLTLTVPCPAKRTFFALASSAASLGSFPLDLLAEVVTDLLRCVAYVQVCASSNQRFLVSSLQRRLQRWDDRITDLISVCNELLLKLSMPTEAFGSLRLQVRMKIILRSSDGVHTVFPEALR